MTTLLPLVRKTCILNTSPLLLRRGLISMEYIMASRESFTKKEFSTKTDNEEAHNDSRYVSIKEKPYDSEIQTTFSKVRETTKTASYLGVILFGLGVTGIIFYTVLRELFSGKSPNNIYSIALERCRNEPTIQNVLGMPIKGFGEESRRGRRRHVSHVIYQKDGVEHLRMKFYIEGLRKKATVHLEMKEDDSGKYQYRYLFVETDDFGRPPIVLEDNRFGHIDPPRGKRIGEDETFKNELSLTNI